MIDTDAVDVDVGGLLANDDVTAGAPPFTVLLGVKLELSVNDAVDEDTAQGQSL